VIVTIVIAVVVALGVGSWFVDRRRRRRNAALDEQGLLTTDDAHRVVDPKPEGGSEAGIAEALLRGGRHTL
jgi:hypothetical protein